MASQYSLIKRSTDEFKRFLDLKRDEFEDARQEYKPGKGWNIPYRSAYIFQLVQEMYDTLYWGIHPLLFDDDPTPGEVILVRFERTLSYLAKQEESFADIAKHSDGGVLDMVSTPIYDLWQQAFDKLTEVVALAKADMEAAVKPAATDTAKPARKKAVPPQLPVVAPPTFKYKYKGMPWHKPPRPTFTRVRFDELLSEEKEVALLIIVATEVEFSQVIRLLKPLSGRVSPVKLAIKNETYYLGIFGCFKTVVCKSMMGAGGPTGSTLVADNAIKQWKPLALIMIGIAFGISHTVQKAADVLVARDLFLYEPQRVGEITIPRGPIPTTDSTLLNRFDNVSDWEFLRPDKTQVEVHIGRVFSGDKLIDNPKFKAGLVKLAKEAKGGEMEGAGIWAAAARNSVAWILAKGVCDWADHKAGSLQEMAAASAASLCEHVFSDEQALDGLHRPQ